jgi:hypothetical protein
MNGPGAKCMSIATTDDLESLEHRLLDQVHREVTRLIMWFVPTMLTTVGLAFIAARFS